MLMFVAGVLCGACFGGGSTGDLLFRRFAKTDESISLSCAI